MCTVFHQQQPWGVYACDAWFNVPFLEKKTFFLTGLDTTQIHIMYGLQDSGKQFCNPNLHCYLGHLHLSKNFNQPGQPLLRYQHQPLQVAVYPWWLHAPDTILSPMPAPSASRSVFSRSWRLMPMRWSGWHLALSRTALRRGWTICSGNDLAMAVGLAPHPGTKSPNGWNCQLLLVTCMDGRKSLWGQWLPIEQIATR